ncbi:hypothetical protein FX987_02375 [Vreelandella titanicae]|uniref:Phage protein n=2 Tax=Vreelandella titanicae TaxID=664683 RepID=A0AAP9NMI0_9GAMM|nr:hypothetical protein FX987_02375 [Halomonas titanicae]
MSIKEFEQWCVYRNVYGPLDNTAKVCEYIKHLTFTTLKIAGDKKINIEDLELFVQKEKEEKYATTDDLLNLFDNL